MTENNELWTAYTDGASRGNPGQAGCGVAITSPQGEPIAVKKYLGIKTNNQAEYTALILALQKLLELNASQVLIRADSELMVKQLKGEYRVKNPNIQPLFAEAKKLCTQFKKINFEHVPREQNKAADKLANMAIDEAELEQ